MSQVNHGSGVDASIYFFHERKKKESSYGRVAVV